MLWELRLLHQRMFASTSSSGTQVTELSSSLLNFYCRPSYLAPFWIPKRVPGCQLSWITAVHHHFKALLSHEPRHNHTAKRHRLPQPDLL